MTRFAFKNVLEDVEFIRKYIAEAAWNNNNNNNDDGNHYQRRAMMTMAELSQTLDTKARNISDANTTTLEVGLGYVDDRKDRRIERYVSQVNAPLVGTKQTDLDLIEPVADIFPWMVDRTCANQGKEDYDHHNPQNNERLYVAAWIGTHGEAWMYYPPFSATYGHAMNFGDVLGANYNSHEEEFVKPNLPQHGGVIDKAYFTPPYPDTAIPGLSLITAQAPIYLSGSVQGYDYNQTYIASTGLDISVSNMAAFLKDLEGTVTVGSFAMVVSYKDFHTILISQSTVDKIYPEYTGNEDVRVTYDTAGSTMVSDRRNQSYLVSDTIFQPIVNLTNSQDWKMLEEDVQALRPGERSYSLIGVTLTNEESLTSFYVIYERWDEVVDWVLLLFVPQQELDSAVSIEMAVAPNRFNHNNSDNDNENDVHIEVFLDDNGDEKSNGNNNGQDVVLGTSSSFTKTIETVFRNSGALDLTLSLTKVPDWLELMTQHNNQEQLPPDVFFIPAGQSLMLKYRFRRDELPGGGRKTHSTSGVIAVTVHDKDYSNCFFKQVLTTNVFVDVYQEAELNQLGTIRVYGFILCTIVSVSAVGWSIWVFLHASHRVVKASQPVFLHMMCAGILVMGLSLIPLSIDDSLASPTGCSIACMAFPWLLSIGFSMSFSALFSKVWRINQIVKGAKNYRRVHISTRDVLVPFAVICTANVVILGIWSGVDPLVWVRETMDGETKESEGANYREDTYGHCSVHENVFGLVCLVLLVLVNFGALVLALIQLYHARELSTEYSEGKYIAIAMGSMIQVFLTGLPILVIVTDSPRVSYFVKSTIVFTLAMSLLLLTFLPKFYITTAEHKTQNSSGEVGSSGESPAAERFRALPMPSSSEVHSLPDICQASSHKRVYFSDISGRNNDHWKQGISSFGLPAAEVRGHTLSEMSISLTPSAYDALGHLLVHADRTMEASICGPMVPVRLPSVMEDSTDSGRSEGKTTSTNVESNADHNPSRSTQPASSRDDGTPNQDPY